MTLSDQITHDIADAMKARDSGRLSALRMLKAALMNSAVTRGRDLEDTEAQQVLASLIKQRRDSIDQFKAAGRTDLVDKESAEIRVLEQYAPPAVDPADLERTVDSVIKETGATSSKDLGRVMKAVMAALAGKSIDGKAVSDAVKRKLSS